MNNTLRFLVALACSGFVLPLAAQEDAAALAKQLANPVAALISVPFQNNADFGIGEWEGTRNTMNFQPVVPIELNDNLNLIGRMILPFISQYSVTGPGSRETGLGDILLSGFFSPVAADSDITWGAGPAFLLPVGSKDFSLDQFGIGPTAVALKQSGGLTYGALFNQIWALNGDEDTPDFSQLFLQPFLNYNWPSGAGLGGNFELTQNWTADQTTLWFNPILTGVTSLGKQRVQLAAGPRFNLLAPDGARADWGVRTVMVLLFPQ